MPTKEIETLLAALPPSQQEAYKAEFPEEFEESAAPPVAPVVEPASTAPAEPTGQEPASVPVEIQEPVQAPTPAEEPKPEVQKDEEKKIHSAKVEEGRARVEARKRREAEQRAKELEAQNAALLAKQAELEESIREKLSAAPSGTQTSEENFLDAAGLTDEEKQFLDNPAIASGVAKLAQKAIEKHVREIKGVKESIEKERQALLEKQCKADEIDFALDVEDGTGLSAQEVADIQDSDGFKAILKTYNPATGETLGETLDRAKKALRAEPLIVAIQNFRAAQSGSPERAAAAAEHAKATVSPSIPAPAHKPEPVPAKKTYTLNEWANEIERLRHEGGYYIAGGKVNPKIQELLDANAEGRVAD